MADAKISALPAAATPLAGTEVLPVVQGGATEKVSVDNLTAGRDVDVKKLTATDNVVVGTAGKGIDFSANTNAPGMTSELLNWYEEGTWTPVVTGSTSAGTANYDFRIARYTRIGRMVQFEVAMQWNSGTGTGNLRIDGLPFTNVANYTSVAIGRIEDVALSASHVATAFVEANATYINIWQCPVGGGTSIAVPYDAAGLLFIAGSYSV